MKYVIADTRNGKLRGFEQNGVNIWRGVPYALPPVGRLRYKTPVPVSSWEGVRDALEFGPMAFQRGKSPISCGDIPQAEDCLYLNVVSPASSEGKKPVIFWIHGGAFINGSGSLPIYDGTKFAINGDVVMVSINYRLGAFGFLKLSQFGHGYEDNLGLLDQIAALKWVKENIEAFGGDSDNITVMGESAGAMSINCLLSMPKVNKLFSKAILQSGNLELNYNEKKAASVTLSFLNKLNIDENNIESLEKVTEEELVCAAEELGEELHEGIDNLIFRPCVNNQFLKEPAKSIREGAAKGIPILIGTNLHEGWLFTREESKAENITDLKFWKDSVYIAETQSKFASVFMYRFDYAIPEHPLFSRAVHSLEVPFVFNNLEAFKLNSEENQVLADKMQKLWIAFVKTGNPQTKDIKWLEYEEFNRSTLIFNDEITVVNDPEKDKRMKVFSD